MNQQINKQYFKLTNADVVNVIKNKWSHDDIINYKKELKKIDYVEPTSLKFKKLIKKEIARIDKKCHKLSPIIMRNQYTHFELEEGFHEWRRAIRWISIIILVYKIFFSFKVEEKNKYKDLYILRNKPFTSLKGGDESIKINENKFLLLSKYIGDIGLIKDEAENLFYENGSCSEKIQDMHKIYKKFMKSKILNKIIS